MQLTESFPQLLRQALTPLGHPAQCALLNYPNHPNIGDHLIWAGTVDYLQRVNQTKVAYAADPDSYSERRLSLALATTDPIFLLGGGNLGDLWPELQEFHERVVATHPNRPIFFLPQSLHFRDGSRARRAANIFNAHGGLTIFLRDQSSYIRAAELFTNCQLHLAPDMAFQLAGFFHPADSTATTTLILARGDRETLPLGYVQEIDGIQQDWVSIEQKWRWGHRDVPLSRTLARWVREGWQRRLRNPAMYRLRKAWLDDLRSNPATFGLVRGPFCELSLGLIWDGYHQLRAHRAVVTDRLHAYLLATMLGMPSVLLPNTYPKNKSFHETWLSHIPWCRFVEGGASVPEALAAVIAAKPERSER